MEQIKQSVELLKAVRATMDTISVTGIENQDRFVGCANVVQSVGRKLEEVLQELAREEKEDAADG